jgi:hypothetical protein
MELKLTAGPKKAAMEHLRKKIEVSTERIHAAKLKEEEARKNKSDDSYQWIFQISWSHGLVITFKHD